MAPTLPTELIQLIFQHLYDQVRSFEGYNADDPFSTTAGRNVAWFFSQLLPVSKTFRQLAWPFLVRDLIDARFRPYIWHTVAIGKRQYLLEHVRSLEIPADCALVEQIALLRKCSQLRSLGISGERDAAGVIYLPKVTTLIFFEGTEGVEGITWLNILRSLPSLRHLSVSLPSPPRPFPAIDATFNGGEGWHLSNLLARSVHQSALPQLLAIMRDSAPTLEVLSFPPPADFSYVDNKSIFNGFITGPEILAGFSAPLPFLRRLQLSHCAVLSKSSDILCQRLLPVLEHLEVTITDSTIDQLLNVTTSIRRVLLFPRAMGGMSRASPAVTILSTFISTHPHLELLSLDFMTHTIPEEDWSTDLEEQCSRHGVILASNDPRFGDSNGHKWYGGVGEHPYYDDDDEDGVYDEYGEPCSCRRCRGSLEDDQSNQSSESVTTGVGSSGVAELLDFDAEDDEMWAEQWSEEKREAMGFVAQLEKEHGAEGSNAESAEAEPSSNAEDSPTTA